MVCVFCEALYPALLSGQRGGKSAKLQVYNPEIQQSSEDNNANNPIQDFIIHVEKESTSAIIRYCDEKQMTILKKEENSKR